MSSKIDTQPHGIVAKTFHWSFVVIFAYGIFKQIDSTEQLSDPALLRFEIVFAALFLVLLVVRFAFMKLTRPTALPEDTPPLMKRAARVGHLATYASVGMIAVSGLCIGALYSIGLQEGALMTVTIVIHETSVTASYIMIALHIAAALYHRLMGDGIWSSMVPVWREK